MLSKNAGALRTSKYLRHLLQETGDGMTSIRFSNDSEPGIRRHQKKDGFLYFKNGKLIRDEATLRRIRRLAVPPAWQNVWICADANGHLQATGLDMLGRKQYRYHEEWSKTRNETKFHKLYTVGKALPKIRKRLRKDLSLPGLPLQKVLAAAVSLIEASSIRPGSNLYEKHYGSFGITTLKDRHVKFQGAKMIFRFRGKKGVEQRFSIRNKKLSTIIKQCRDIPGKELFQYYDENGGHHHIDSGTLNNYLKEISEEDITAKDLRTWTGSVKALVCFRDLGKAANAGEQKRKTVTALDEVAKHLGNTRAVCKKYYVYPQIISLYEDDLLEKHFRVRYKCKALDLSQEEKVLMKLLKNGSQ
ncbi:MAG: DNA topoisomerase IB [Bacteroidia bacterium]